MAFRKWTIEALRAEALKFETKKEFRPISVVDNEELGRVIKNIRPVIVKC